MNKYSKDKRMLEYGLNESYPDIFCFSTTRHGGGSAGEYASFNCNPFCGDDAASVARNRELLSSLLPCLPDALVIPHQTHDTRILQVDRRFVEASETERRELAEGIDALMTDIPGQCLCISTADCIPVLCYDVRHRVVAAIHAGWRGTVERIVSKTLKAMGEAYGTRGEDVVACIGPGISLASFEVGDEVYRCFADAGFPMRRIARRYSKWHIDLWEANRIQLLDAGVCEENIEVSGICTYLRNDDFFSARRQGIRSGRILTGIMLLAPL